MDRLELYLKLQAPYDIDFPESQPLSIIARLVTKRLLLYSHATLQMHTACLSGIFGTPIYYNIHATVHCFTYAASRV